MGLQFALVAGLYFMATIKIAERKWLFATWNIALGTALLLSTIAVILKETGVLKG